MKDERPAILIVDDDEQILKQIEWALAEEYRVLTAGNRASALQVVQMEKVPVVLLDLGLPPYPRQADEGLATLDELIAQDPLVKVIIVSGNSERQNALKAIERGAHDIFPKPVDLDELTVVLHRVYRVVELERESREERDRAHGVSFEDIIGSSPPMQEVFATMRKAAPSEVPVLILGESGTGKELVANALHNLSSRNKGPFVPINCSAIPATLLESELFGHEKGSFTGAVAKRRGKLEYADRGTLFLDEIGELAPDLQVKLLRFLQEKVIERVGGRETVEVDCRVIAATNLDLAAEVRANRFREDLYFRLAVVKIRLPPLRERGEDIMALADHLMASYCRELKKPLMKFSKPARDVIRRYGWPGNVRELQNRIKRALVLSDGEFIVPESLELPAESTTAARTLKGAKEGLERELVSSTLLKFNGNKTMTAKALGISRPTLYELLARYGL